MQIKKSLLEKKMSIKSMKVYILHVDIQFVITLKRFKVKLLKSLWRSTTVYTHTDDVTNQNKFHGVREYRH